MVGQPLCHISLRGIPSTSPPPTSISPLFEAHLFGVITEVETEEVFSISQVRPAHAVVTGEEGKGLYFYVGDIFPHFRFDLLGTYCQEIWH